MRGLPHRDQGARGRDGRRRHRAGRARRTSPAAAATAPGRAGGSARPRPSPRPPSPTAGTCPRAGAGRAAEQAEAQADAGARAEAATETAAPAAPEPASAPARRSAPWRPSGLVLSPVVRRLIAEHDLDPTVHQGTGAGGRITRSDVAPRRRGRRPPRPPPSAPAATAAPASRARSRAGRCPSRRHRWRLPKAGRAATRSCRSTTSGGAPPSTWCVEGDVAPRLHDHGGGLRGGRAGPPGAQGRVQGEPRASASPTCPSSPGRWSTRSPSSRT